MKIKEVLHHLIIFAANSGKASHRTSKNLMDQYHYQELGSATNSITGWELMFWSRTMRLVHIGITLSLSWKCIEHAVYTDFSDIIILQITFWIPSSFEINYFCSSIYSRVASSQTMYISIFQDMSRRHIADILPFNYSTSQ